MGNLQKGKKYHIITAIGDEYENRIRRIKKYCG